MATHKVKRDQDFRFDFRGNDRFSGSTVYIVDSMSAFGAVPVRLSDHHITYLISSANKCIEGVPGFAFVICKKQHLLTCQGQSRSLTLDLYDQYVYMEQNKQFRFTRKSTSSFSFLSRSVFFCFQHRPTQFLLSNKLLTN